MCTNQKWYENSLFSFYHKFFFFSDENPTNQPTNLQSRSLTEYKETSGGKRLKVMALRASATARPPFPPPPSSSSSPPKVWVPPVKLPQKNQSKSKTAPLIVSLPTSTSLSLFALFTIPHDAKALSLPKEQIVSSLNQVKKKKNSKFPFS